MINLKILYPVVVSKKIDDRFTVEQLLEHEFLAKIDYKQAKEEFKEFLKRNRESIAKHATPTKKGEKSPKQKNPSPKSPLRKPTRFSFNKHKEGEIPIDASPLKLPSSTPKENKNHHEPLPQDKHLSDDSEVTLTDQLSDTVRKDSRGTGTFGGTAIADDFSLTVNTSELEHHYVV